MTNRVSLSNMSSDCEVIAHSMNYIQTIKGDLLLTSWGLAEGWKNVFLVEMKGKNYLKKEVLHLLICV